MVSASPELDWRAWCDRADAAARLQRWPDVAVALQRAFALNPTDATIARNLGATLSGIGRPEEAVWAYEQALRLRPDDMSARLSHALLLIDLGRHEKAAAAIDDALQIALDRLRPGSGLGGDEAWFADIRELGLMLDRLNQTDGLRRLLTAAQTAGMAPEKLGSLWASVALRDGRPDEAKRLLLQDCAYANDAHWDRLMTKVADALGDTGEAFAAAGAMNRAAPDYDGWRRRAAHYRAQIRATAQIVTPEWASRIRHADADDGKREPAFVVGFPRSGTTLLDTFLMGHPATFVVEEGRMLEIATGVVSEAPDVDWPHDLVTRARQAYFDELAKHLPSDFAGLTVDKHPLNMLRLAVLHGLFPGAKLIFVQRHPCDVVLSGYMQSFKLNHAMASFLTIEDAADLYDAAMTMWTRSREAVPQSIHTVVYERLTADPEAELRPMIDFLGLDWRDAMLDHQATAEKRGLITTASYDQVVRPLSAAPRGRWRRYRKELEPVLPILLPWAERLGYGAD